MKRSSKKSLAVILAALALAFNAVAVTPAYAAGPWYVTPGGSDANACSSSAGPCATINGAIGKASAGDTVYVATGSYTGTGDEVVLIAKNITLSGGWDAGFTTQAGMSTIDGQQTRKGITTNSGVTATIERFIVQNGGGSGGNGIYNAGTLTLNTVYAHANVRAVQNNSGTLTINNSAFTNNGGIETCGGGIFNSGGTVAINNSTISDNASSPFYCAPISGLATTNDGTVTLNNVTITTNINGGIWSYPANATTLQNSLIAGNTLSSGASADCFSGDILNSAGYNLIGAAACSINSDTGDQIGSPGAPIDPGLMLLPNNGGLTPTHALLLTSPALNAANPAAPGSGGGACLATDQRGVNRPIGAACDIGAYEGYVTFVTSVLRANPNPTSAAAVGFTVTFSESVTGVDTTAPFSDFALTTTGVTGASVSAVSGSGNTYTVTVNTGSGGSNGTIRLDVVDDDSILDTSNTPLGGTGIGSGNFTSGQAYDLPKVPTALTPAGTTIDTTPTYKWNKVLTATNYQYQLVKGAAIVYTKTVPAGACTASTCSNTPINKLANGAYKWKVRAMIAGVWMDFSPEKIFTVSAPKAGLWKGAGLTFYVVPKDSKVDNFTIYISVGGCGNYALTHTPLVVVTNSKFAFGGSFYASGTLVTPTSAKGTVGLRSFYIPGCGYVSGGPFAWVARWKNASQVTNALESEAGIPLVTVMPELEMTIDPFTLDLDHR